MKLGLKVSLWIIVALVAMRILNEGFNLLNQPSDASVAVGILVLLALLVAVFTLGTWITKKINRKFSKPNKPEPMVVIGSKNPR